MLFQKQRNGTREMASRNLEYTGEMASRNSGISMITRQGCSDVVIEDNDIKGLAGKTRYHTTPEGAGGWRGATADGKEKLIYKCLFDLLIYTLGPCSLALDHTEKILVVIFNDHNHSQPAIDPYLDNRYIFGSSRGLRNC